MLALALTLVGGEGVAADAMEGAADSAFESGVELTRDGHYLQALRAFRAAEAAGDRGGRLQFNLGVVYYRLARHIEARAAFARAAQDPETADLAIYNLGLVALASGERARAARYFRQTAQQASAPALRALAYKALETTTGRGPAPRLGSLSLLRGTDSNVVVPVGALGDVPTSMRDNFWEVRSGWAGALGGALPALAYRLVGVTMKYDEVASADLGFAEAGLDWRGPLVLGVGASVLTIDDQGYQRSADLRMSGAVYDEGAVRVVYEAAHSWLEALDDRARDLDGTRLALGASLEIQQAPLSWNLGLRHIVDDRLAASLSPDQNTASLRLRYARGRWAARAWARYTDGKYPTTRHDRLGEFGGDLAVRVLGPCEVLIEATRLDNRSTAVEFDYASNRLYAGLRLRF